MSLEELGRAWRSLEELGRAWRSFDRGVEDLEGARQRGDVCAGKRSDRGWKEVG